MSRLGMVTAMIMGAMLLGTASPAHADDFKSQNECAIGKRVETNKGQKGRITRIEKGGSMCFVQVDGSRETAYLFWMLHNEGVSKETSDKLVPGVYECFAGGRYTFMDMSVTGTNTYESAGERGTFHVEPSKKIVFESGPLSKYNAKLLAGPSIGLNGNGDSFYSTTCELNKKR